MNINFEKTKLKILRWCIEDYTDLYAIYCIASKFYGYKDDDLELVKETTLLVIRILLENELIVSGDLLAGDAFVPWNISLCEVILKIKHFVI